MTKNTEAQSINLLDNKDFIMKNLYIGLQKTSNENIEKKICELEGIESYLYIRVEKENDKKVSQEFLKRANISEIEAWKRAEMNTNAETTVERIEKVLAELMGLEYNEEMQQEIPLFVISNKCKRKGASGILNKKLLSEFSERFHTKKIIILPSSIHEMILIPHTEKIDIRAYSEMVKEINNSIVSSTECLTDRAYILNSSLQ